jgi:hypothetical protein
VTACEDRIAGAVHSTQKARRAFYECHRFVAPQKAHRNSNVLDNVTLYVS